MSRALGVGLAVFVFLTTYVLGTLGAYIGAGLTIILAITALFLPRWRSEAGGTMLFAGFALMAAMIVYNTKPGTDDWVSIINFILFLFAGPAIVAVSAAARPGNALILARLAAASIVVAVAWALYEIYVVRGNIDGLGGIGINRIQSTGAAIILAFFALLGWLADRGRWRLLYLLPPLASVPFVLMGESRGPLIVLAVLALVAVVVLSRHKWRNLTLIVLALVIAGGALVVSPSSFGRLGHLPSIVMSVLNGADSIDNSANIRMRLYKRSLDAFLDSPLTGHGWRGKAEATNAGFATTPKRRAVYHLHSDILDFGVAGGVVGLIAYALLIAGPIVGALKSVQDSQWAARVAGASLLSAGLFSYGLFNAAFGFEFFTAFYVLLTALLLGFCRDKPLFTRSP